MNIEIISGSPRTNSLSRRLAKYLLRWLKENSTHQVGMIDVRDWDLPPVQAVFSSVEKTPDPFKELSRRMFDADAFILVSPEYNGSYSPAMKNLIDHFPKQHHKPFGIATSSPGAFGGMRAGQQLLVLVPALFGIASPYLLVVPFVEKKFDVDGNIIDANFQNNVHNFASEFLWLAESLIKENEIAKS